MQYRGPVGAGPSSNTWPRWLPHRRHRTSTRTMPWDRSSTSSTASATSGSVKLGQPLPDSNLVSESNNLAPHAAHVYVPSAWLWTNFPVQGASVAEHRSTWNLSGPSSLFHSLLVFSTSYS